MNDFQLTQFDGYSAVADVGLKKNEWTLKTAILFFIKFLFFQHNDLEETIKRIQNHKGVVGMMIVNQDGKHFISQI